MNCYIFNYLQLLLVETSFDLVNMILHLSGCQNVPEAITGARQGH